MRKVLLASADTETIESLSRSILATGDYQISAVNSGPEVIRIISRNAISCLVLDMALPGSNTGEIINGVRRSERAKNVPILLITDPRDRKPALTSRQMGASDYLTKPIFSGALLKKINALTSTEARRISEIQRLLAEEGEKDILADIHKHLEKHISFERDRQAILRIHGYTSGNDDILNYKDLFAGDVATAIDLLRMANSIISGARAKVSGFSSMLQRLGSNSIESNYAALKNSKIKINPLAQTLIHDHFRFHSILTACLAEEISAQTCQCNHDELFTAGLFHDIGKLYFITFYSETYAKILESQTGNHDSLPVKEKDAFGIDHAELGVLIFRKLGFSRLLQETCLHGNVLNIEKKNFQNPSSMKIVHLASGLSHILLNDPQDIDFGSEYYNGIKKIIRESRISINVVVGNSVRRVDYMASRLHSKLIIPPELIESVYNNFNIKILASETKEIRTS